MVIFPLVNQKADTKMSAIKEKIVHAKEKIAQVKEYVENGVWEVDDSALPLPKRFCIRATRFFQATLSGFSRHRCALHAAGLTYYSLMSLVPVLCLLVLLARACGAGDFARDKINGTIDQMIVNFEKGPEKLPEFMTKNQSPQQIEAKRQAAEDFAKQARKISNDIFDRIAKVNLKKVGIFGVIILLWTVVSTFGMVEHAFNEVWEVPKPRPLWRKFILYAFVALVLPLLVALALSMPILHVVRTILDATLGATSYTKWIGDALVAMLNSRLFGIAFTLLFTVAAFTFILNFVPHRKVSFRASLNGGIITAFLFGGWLKLCAIAQVGIAKSNAMYGSFAFLPIILAWLYMSWQIILLGSNMTYAFDCIHSGRRPGSDG